MKTGFISFAQKIHVELLSKSNGYSSLKEFCEDCKNYGNFDPLKMAEDFGFPSLYALLNSDEMSEFVSVEKIPAINGQDHITIYKGIVTDDMRSVCDEMHISEMEKQKKIQRKQHQRKQKQQQLNDLNQSENNQVLGQQICKSQTPAAVEVTSSNLNVEQNDASSSKICLESGEKFSKMQKQIDGLQNEVAGLRIENENLNQKLADKNRAIKVLIDHFAKSGGKILKLGQKLEMTIAGLESAKAVEQVNQMNEIGICNFSMPKTDQCNGPENSAVSPTSIMNKWNAQDCGRRLSISGHGLVLTYFGPDYGFNSVRANSPFTPKTQLFYFEVQIIKQAGYGIDIGFCDKQFPLERKIYGLYVGMGKVKNSIGIFHKGGINIDGAFKKFTDMESQFQEGDVIGLGLINSQPNVVKCFASHNGEKLGLVQLPAKFAGVELFPAITLLKPEDSIRANFGNDEWRYNPNQLIHKEKSK